MSEWTIFESVAFQLIQINQTEWSNQEHQVQPPPIPDYHNICNKKKPVIVKHTKSITVQVCTLILFYFFCPSIRAGFKLQSDSPFFCPLTNFTATWLTRYCPLSRSSGDTRASRPSHQHCHHYFISQTVINHKQQTRERKTLR